MESTVEQQSEPQAVSEEQPPEEQPPEEQPLEADATEPETANQHHSTEISSLQEQASVSQAAKLLFAFRSSWLL